MSQALTYSIFPLGDSALTLDFGNVIDKEINRKVLALFEHFRSLSLPFIKDLAPAYSSLTFHYDTVALLHHNANRTGAFEAIAQMIRSVIEKEREERAINPRQIRIPVCYAPKYAPDLSYIAEARGLSTEEIIRIHTSTAYTVYMLGFLPGFAYMGEVDERIAMPRRDQPRAVEGGSVGITGRQTGIYPLDSPGGWQLIGRTPLKLFHKHQEQPVLFQPGDEVHFYSITEDEFAHY